MLLPKLIRRSPQQRPIRQIRQSSHAWPEHGWNAPMGNVNFKVEATLAAIFIFGILMLIVSPWPAASLSAVFISVSFLAFKNSTHNQMLSLVGWAFLLAFLVALSIAGFQERDSLRELLGEEQTQSKIESWRHQTKDLT